MYHDAEQDLLRKMGDSAEKIRSGFNEAAQITTRNRCNSLFFALSAFLEEKTGHLPYGYIFIFEKSDNSVAIELTYDDKPVFIDSNGEFTTDPKKAAVLATVIHREMMSYGERVTGVQNGSLTPQVKIEINFLGLAGKLNFSKFEIEQESLTLIAHHILRSQRSYAYGTDIRPLFCASSDVDQIAILAKAAINEVVDRLNQHKPSQEPRPA